MSKFKSIIIYIKEKCKQKEFLYTAIFYEFLGLVFLAMLVILFCYYLSYFKVFLGIFIFVAVPYIITSFLIVINEIRMRKRKIKLKFSIKKLVKFVFAIVICILIFYSVIYAFLPFSRVGIYDILYPHIKNENVKKLFATDILASIYYEPYFYIRDINEKDIKRIMKYFPEFYSEEEFINAFNRYHNEKFYDENSLYFSLPSIYSECAGTYLYNILDLGKDAYINEFNNLANINSISKGYFYVLVMIYNMDLSETKNEIIMEHLEEIYVYGPDSDTKEMKLAVKNLSLRSKLYELRGDEYNKAIIDSEREEILTILNSESEE